MLIKELELTNYTNYHHEAVNFHPYLNFLIGDNAQGKSNLIDSVFFLGLARSHRYPKDSALIRWGQDYFRLRGLLQNSQGLLTIEHAFKKGKKLVKVNGSPLVKLNNLMGQFKLIIFTPDDLALIKGSPDERRRFLNRKIVQIRPIYYEYSLSYQRILSQRNNLLKRGKASRPEIETWNEQLADYGSLIIAARNDILIRLAPIAQSIHQELSGRREEFQVVYDSQLDIAADTTTQAIKNIFQEKLQEVLSEDLRKGYTLFGPHRDDFKCSINGIDVRNYGSQGQQRTSVLTLKLAMLQLMKEATGEYPVLLLDDVFSELDQNRREYLLHTVSHSIQTIITATDLTSLNKPGIQDGQIFHIVNGKIS